VPRCGFRAVFLPRGVELPVVFFLSFPVLLFISCHEVLIHNPILFFFLNWYSFFCTFVCFVVSI